MTSENLGTPEVEEMTCMENTAFGLATCAKLPATSQCFLVK